MGVRTFPVISSSSGGNQNLIFDAPTFTTVPEPSTFALCGMSMLITSVLVRRRH